MDQATLLGPDIHVGLEALSPLDMAGIERITSLPVVFPEYSNWKFVLSSPSLDEDRRLKAYERVAENFAGRFVYTLPNYMLFRTKDPFIRDLHKRYGKVKEAAGMRLRNETIGGRFIEAGCIYRIA